MTATERLRAASTTPADAAGLGAFRILLGALLCFSTARVVWRGWVKQIFIDPSFHFTYLGFDWVRPWPAWGMYLHFLVMGAAALALTFGAWTRLSAWIFCACFSYAELLEKAAYLNHYYLVSLLAFLLGVLPTGRAYAIDSRFRGGASSVRVFDYWVLRAQVAIVYLFAGAAKLNADWLLQAQPLRSWLPVHADFPLVGPLLAEPPAAFMLAWAGALYDLTIPFLLIFPRTRALGFVLVVSFHLGTHLLFPIGVFPWLMIATATVFFDPAWPRRVLDRLRSRTEAVEMGSAPSLVPNGVGRPSSPYWARGGAIAWLAYFALQLMLPLRFLAYPGEVNWTEQGFRFAWRVMLIEKTGQVDYEVFTDAGRRFRVYPRRELTSLQYRMMSTQPDMIHEFALHIRDRYQRLGHTGVRVHAHAFASLNGRASQPLIDPTVDLGALARALCPRNFIVPLNSEPPREL